MRSLFVWLFLVGGAAQAGELRMIDVPIESVSISEHEEEGGSSAWTYYPSGYMHFQGHASCCGYRPSMADGWYRMKPEATRIFFDKIAAQLALQPESAKCEDKMNGARSRVVVAGKSIESCGRLWIDDDGLLVDGKQPQPKPRDWNARPRSAQRIADDRVLRASLGILKDVSTFSREEANEYIEALRRERSRDMGVLETAVKGLSQLPNDSVDLIASLLTKDRPSILRVSDVIVALGAHGAAAQAHVEGIVAAVTDDGTLVAAGVALAAISGPAANAALEKKIVPRFGEPPREKNLPIYYRLEFGRALIKIGTPAALAVLDGKIFNALFGYLTRPPLSRDKLSDGAASNALFAGRKDAKQMDHAFRMLLASTLRDRDPLTRRAAVETASQYYRANLPVDVRRAIEGLINDVDHSVKSVAAQALAIK